MSGAEKNQPPAVHVQPDVSSGGGTQLKKGPRAPNLSTKQTLISETQERQSASQNANERRSEEMTIAKPKDGLNAAAQEFVPKKHHVLSPEAKAFIPQSSQRQQIHIIGNDAEFPEEENFDLEGHFQNLTVDYSPYTDCPPYKGSSDAEYDIILRFKEVLQTLTLSPGNMEEYLKPLCELIEDRAESKYLAESLCDLLLEQSIQVENFRYTGARLCQFLNNNLTKNSLVVGFAKMFINRCGQEFNKRHDLLCGSDEDKRNLCGLAIFMAELFLNVEVKLHDGTRARYNFMPPKLAEMIMTLLSDPVDMTVKCVCQLLKLVGGFMEDCAKVDKEMDGDFKNIFVKLKDVSESHISKNIKNLVQSVFELRNKNWNRSTTSPPKKEEPLKPAEVTFQQEPVFYRNGRACTRDEVDLPDETERYPYVLTDEEELAFLEWQAEQEGTPLPWNDTGYDSCQLPNDIWMGDDLEAAYEEFLQGQGQTYGGSQGANETAGFPRQVNTVVSQHSQYQYQSQPPTEETFHYSHIERNQVHHHFPSYYEPEGRNQMLCPPHPLPQPQFQPQPQPQPQHPHQPYHQQQQQPFDPYKYPPPNNSSHYQR